MLKPRPGMELPGPGLRFYRHIEASVCSYIFCLFVCLFFEWVGEDCLFHPIIATHLILMLRSRLHVKPPYNNHVRQIFAKWSGRSVADLGGGGTAGSCPLPLLKHFSINAPPFLYMCPPLLKPKKKKKKKKRSLYIYT